MNPFDLPGPEFLVFYLVLSVVVLVAVTLLRHKREDGPVPRFSSVDPYLIAHLRGGVPETIRAAVLSLVDRGLLVAEGTTLRATPWAASRSVARPIERALLEACATPVDASTLFENQAVDSACLLLGHELARQRLLPDDQQENTRFLLALVGSLVLLGVAGLKLSLALDRGRSNVTFLIVLAVLSILLLYAFVIKARRARLGDRVIEDLQALFSGLRARADDLPTGGATNELALLVGIFGMAALTGDLRARAAALFPRAQADSGSSSSCASSGCGSSCGGGGGGCGGCGGGGD